MLRIYKLYDFDLSIDGTNLSKRVPAARSSFSSYPGSIFSGDDFYVLSSGLVVQETTIGYLFHFISFFFSLLLVSLILVLFYYYYYFIIIIIIFIIIIITFIIIITIVIFIIIIVIFAPDRLLQ
jgi:hypothetical protein